MSSGQHQTSHHGCDNADEGLFGVSDAAKFTETTPIPGFDPTAFSFWSNPSDERFDHDLSSHYLRAAAGTSANTTEGAEVDQLAGLDRRTIRRSELCFSRAPIPRASGDLTAGAHTKLGMGSTGEVLAPPTLHSPKQPPVWTRCRGQILVVVCKAAGHSRP